MQPGPSVFISSTRLDLVEHRRVVIETLRRQKCHVVAMEDFGARPEEPTAACIAEIEACDVVVGIYAHRYGCVPPNETRSITEIEYDTASALKKPVYCYVLDPDQAWPSVWIETEKATQLAALKSKAETRIAARFTTPDDLARQVSADLARHQLSIREKAPPSTEVDARQQFAKFLLGQLDLLDGEEDWADRRFTELIAEVEAEGGKEHRQLRRASLIAALRESMHRLILLEGDPGSGKSIALRRLARVLTQEVAREDASELPLPLYVNLKELSGAHTLERYVRDRVCGDDADARAHFDRVFERDLKDGRWLILFDAFDEIPEVLSSTEPDAVVHAYASAIQRFAHGMHASRVIVSARPYRGPGRMPWPRFRVLPLGDARRRAFVRAWFDDEETAERVSGELLADSELGAWSSNPLLLGLICAHRRAEGALPRTPHDAFESFVERRVNAHPEVLASLGLSAAELRDRAELIAFCMTADRQIGLVTNSDALGSSLRERGAPEAHLDRATDGLRQMRFARGSSDAATSRRSFAFVHRRLQEYFATCYVLSGKGSVDADRLLTDERWRETVVTLLVAGDSARLSPILERAVGLLQGHVAELCARDASFFDGLDESKDFEAIEALRYLRVPVEFPWPSGALHVLGIISELRLGSSATEASVSRALSDVASHADRLLLAAIVRGTRIDQAWALELLAAASEDVRALMLSWAFASGSPWLEDIAFVQAGHLRTLPPDVAQGVRDVVVWAELSGRLRAEPMRLEAQVRRVDRDGELLAVLDLMRVVRSIDRAILAVVGIAFLSACAHALEPSIENYGKAALFAGASLLLAYFVPLMALVTIPTLRGASPYRARQRKQPSWLTRIVVGQVASTTEAHSIMHAMIASFSCCIRLFVPLSIALAVEGGPRAEIPGLAAGILLGTYLLCFRPGAYLAARRGTLRARRWFLVPFEPAIVIASSFRSRSTWMLVLRLTLILIPFFLVSSRFNRAWEGIGIVLAGFWTLTMGTALYLYAADRIRYRRFVGRSGNIEVDQMLRCAERLRFPNHRVTFLRWVREQGRMQPTPEGARVLREVVTAIERDAARWASSSKIGKPAADPAWSTEFTAWYREYAGRRKKGLADWHGEALDELSRLALQTRLRIADKTES